MPQSVARRFDQANGALREYEAVSSKIRPQVAALSGPPNEQLYDILSGDDVFVYREDKGFQGLYILINVEGKITKVLNEHGKEHNFQSTMVKAYA